MSGKVMVIGGTGNMGAFTVSLLLDRGYEVHVISRGRNRSAPVPDAVFHTIDRNNAEEYRKCMLETACPFVIDLACQTPEQAKVTWECTREAERVVFVSSVSAYGRIRAEELPVREDYVSGEIVWEYGQRKRSIEKYYELKYLESGYPVTIMRPTITYGRLPLLIRQIGMDNAWIDRIRKGKPIVTGDPMILRNFLYAGDAAYALVGALEHPVCIGQTYNMVPLKPKDWGTFHRTVMQAAGREVEMVPVTYEQLRKGESPEFPILDMIPESYRFNGYFSGEKIARDIPEFRERTSLQKGIADTVEFLDRNHLIPDCDKYSWEDEYIRRYGQ